MQTGGTTVIVPTTADRGLLLERSVGSALAQRDRDLEVFIVGDGLDRSGLPFVRSLEAADDRVRFFDFPKDERRGEWRRHRILMDEARGNVVAYLTDRDLWLPNHVSELRRALADADFAHTLRFGIGPADEIEVIWRSDLRQPSVRDRLDELTFMAPLSFVGHTMESYRRLPHGWRVTPLGTPTDHHMWQQFLDQPWCRVGVSSLPTVLYFKRGEHPGLSTQERLALLEVWSARAGQPGFVEQLGERITEALVADRSSLVERLAQSPADRLRRRTPVKLQAAMARALPRDLVASLRLRFDTSRLG